MFYKPTFSPHVFLQRISNRDLITSSLWLLLYASLPTAIAAALIIWVSSYFTPGLLETITTSSSQKQPQWFPNLVFNPIFETLLLLLIIRISIKIKFGAFSIIVGAVALSMFHSLLNPYWGITVFFFFLIQSYALYYAFFNDFKRGFSVIALTHSMHNAWVLTVIYHIDILF